MNILIIKTGALGDVVRTTFLAQALKEKYSKSNPKVYWITQEKALPLFINNPYVHKVIDVNSKKSIERIFFDMVINLEEDIENCTFVSKLKYKEVIGFVCSGETVVPTPSAKEWFDMSALGRKPANDILKKNNRKTHRQIMGEMIGVNWKKYTPFLRLTDFQRDFAQGFLRRHNLSRTDLIIGINTGAADRWPKALSVKKTSELINKIYKEFGAKILLFGGPNEIDRNNEIIRMSKAPVITTGCGNDLVEFPALVSLCSIFITSDSLGMHIALALKRKTIVMVGPTSFYEVDMYGLGDKIAARSNCICCYRKDCKSMNNLNIIDVIKSLRKLVNQKISLIITAFKEPNIGKSLEAAMNQKTKKSFEILVSVPDKETIEIVKRYMKKDKRINLLNDPGKGKSYALNWIFSSVDSDILILTDGDVQISDNSIEEISNLFLDPEIGCVTGRPVPAESRKTKYGYWANFLFNAAHKLRKKAFESNSFLECSGYLFAFRKKEITQIPLDVAEDSVIPYFFWEKGYRIGYAEKAQVHVKNPTNWNDWMKQKIRTSKAHETLNKYVDVKTTPRVKTFSTEAKGIFWALQYPKTLPEYFWTIELVLSRLYMWTKVFFDTRILNRHYGDAWERVESTK